MLKRTGKLGEGAYGSVYKVDYNGKSFALKRNMVETDPSFIITLRELDVMVWLGKHPNIIKLEMVTDGNPLRHGPMTPVRERRRDDTLHFALELGNITLHDLFYTEKGKDITVDYIQFMADALIGLEYIHKKGFIHRDIKSCNLILCAMDEDLLNDLNDIKYSSKYIVKICDFGMAKPFCNQDPQTPRLSTPIYRSPELVVEHPKYNKSVDVWGVGCIFYEMAFRRSLIRCDIADNPDQIMNDLLVKICNKTDSKVYDKLISEGGVKVNQSCNVMVKSFTDYFTKDTKEKFDKNIGKLDLFLDLLSKLLEFDSSKRLTAKEALEHKFFDSHQSYINLIRSKYSGTIEPIIPITIKNCIERRWVFENAFKIFRNRLAINWYSHRILFQAIDLFDRYLHVAYPKRVTMVETKHSGVLHSKHETEYRFFSCLYISIKYFSSLYIPPSFNEFISSIYVNSGYSREDYVRLTEVFEKQLVMKMLSYKVYRTTPYEIADSHNITLDDRKVEILLNTYFQFSSHIPITSNVIFDQFLKDIRNIII